VQPVGRPKVAKNSESVEMLMVPAPVVSVVEAPFQGPTRSTWKATIGANWLSEIVPPTPKIGEVRRGQISPADRDREHLCAWLARFVGYTRDCPTS
jgi:hypothetical protein